MYNEDIKEYYHAQLLLLYPWRREVNIIEGTVVHRNYNRGQNIIQKNTKHFKIHNKDIVHQ